MAARELARRGASVVGVDVSEKLLEIARRYEREEPRGISYLLDDARTLEELDDAGFDGVVCNMALMDISDLDACLGLVAWFSQVERRGRWVHQHEGERLLQGRLLAF